MPDPRSLKGYNDCFEGGAKAVFELAKAQSEHRMQLENTVIQRELNQSGKSQNYAFIIATALLIVSGILIYTGHDIAGTTIGTVDLVALATVFIVGKNNIKKDLESKINNKPGEQMEEIKD